MKISLKLNTFIGLAAGFLFLLSAGVSLVNLVAVDKIEKSEIVLKQENEFELIAVRAQYHVAQVQQFLTDASLTHELDSVREAKENFASFEKDLDSLKALHSDYAERTERLRASGQQLLAVGLEMTDAYIKNGKAAGDEIMKRSGSGLDARSEELTKLLEDLVNESRAGQMNSESHLSGVIHWLKMQSAIFSLLLASFTLLVFGLLYRRLKPLTAVNGKLAQNASMLTAASVSMKGSAESLAGANHEQAAATQETAASLEEIRAMVAKTEDSSELLKGGADSSQNLVNVGKDRLQKVQEHLHDIERETEKLVTEVTEGNKEIAGIISIISEIGAKTKVINDIVFQTKLLSFNASVEAARAGENGKGFAVVAEEVGNLANMSGQAAKEISDMLTSGIGKVESIIKANSSRIESSIGVSKSKIVAGVETANQCGDAFNQIVNQVAEVKNASEDITTAIREQRKGLDEIGKAIASLERSAHQSVNVSQSVKENGFQLAGSVDGLNQTIGEITGIISGQPDNGMATGAAVQGRVIEMPLGKKRAA